jgi:RimJ/RimL family protein N-acetyltransferase
VAYEPLELRPFDARDFAQLIAQVPDARFLLQWSGPEYAFPLDSRQLRETLAKTRGKTPSFKVYKAVLSGAAATIGHVQLMDIDYESGTCILGRVLIFPEHRGKGLGKFLVRSALHEAFAGLGLREVTLRVLAFNRPAVATYESVGFVKSRPGPGPHLVDGESWDVFAMELSQARWWELNAKSESPRPSGPPA